MHFEELTNSNGHVTCKACWLSLDLAESKVGFVQATGEYRRGSIGSPDADLICEFIHDAFRAYSHKIWLYDFRELSYTWGDEMECVIGMPVQLGLEHDRFAFVAGEHCFPAMKSLVVTSGTDPIETLRDDSVFGDLQSALDHLKRSVA